MEQIKLGQKVWVIKTKVADDDDYGKPIAVKLSIAYATVISIHGDDVMVEFSGLFLGSEKKVYKNRQVFFDYIQVTDRLQKIINQDY